MEKRVTKRELLDASRRVLTMLLAIVLAVGLVPALNLVSPQLAEAYTPRTDRPAADNPNYYSSINPYYAFNIAPTGIPTEDGAYITGNCTWYAWGRAREILGTSPAIGRGNPLGMWEYTRTYGTYKTGLEPRIGALCVGRSSGDYHVSVVEDIVDGVPYVSESGYTESENPPSASDVVFHYGPATSWMGGGIIGYIYLLEEPVNVEAVTAFAERLYTEVLDREPDPAGLECQVNALCDGWAPAEIAYNYFNSQEYFEKNESASRTVERVYQVMFGRAYDDEGKAFWCRMMDNGMSVRKVVAGFSESKEYRDYFGSIGIDASQIPIYSPTADMAWEAGELIYAGGNGRDLNEGASAFAKRMYTVVLNRDDSLGGPHGIDVAGLNVQAAAIANGMPCWQIAVNFFESEEFGNWSHSDYQTISIAYEAILGRSGSHDEIKAWLAVKQASCYSNSDIVLHFCNSPEFNDICSKYSLVSGMYGPDAPALPTPQAHSWRDGACTRCGAVLVQNGLNKDLKSGDHVSFGAYEQDNNVATGPEPIEWLVLDVKDGKALLLSRYGLDCKQYNSASDSATWSESTLRSWLNNEFYRAAFTGPESASIALTDTNSPNNPAGSITPGAGDRVFVLSQDEAEPLSYDARMCVPTPYAIAQGAFTALYKTDEGGTCAWWLRTPGFAMGSVLCVDIIGRIGRYGGSVSETSTVVRPAMWVLL